MFLREPASRVLRQSPGMIPAPTVTVRMEEAMFFVCVHFLHALKVQCMGVFFYENKCPPSCLSGDLLRRIGSFDLCDPSSDFSRAPFWSTIRPIFP